MDQDLEELMKQAARMQAASAREFFMACQTAGFPEQLAFTLTVVRVYAANTSGGSQPTTRA